MARIIRTRNVASGDMLVYYSDNFNANLDTASLKQEVGQMLTRPVFRFFLLNSDESVRDIIPEANIITGGSYNENYQSGQRRSLSLTLYNESGNYTPSINGIWAHSKIRFEMGLQLANDDIIWMPKGVYAVTSASPRETTTEKTVSLDLSDKFSVLEGADGTLEISTEIPVGTEIESVIRDLLSTDRGNGEMIDSIPFVYNSAFKGKRTTATISKEAGATVGEIILELATMLSAEVFYDVEGHLTFVPIDDVSNDVDKPILYDLYDYSGDFADNNLSIDLNDVINRVIVIGANVNSEICDAVAVNDDPASPLCYQRIGYRTASPINDSNITSTQLAEERAKYELRQKLILKSTVSNSIRYNPLLTVNNLITVTDEFYGLKQERFLIQSISCPIDYSGTMSITSTNARNLPFVVGG